MTRLEKSTINKFDTHLRNKAYELLEEYISYDDPAKNTIGTVELPEETSDHLMVAAVYMVKFLMEDLPEEDEGNE